jgi:nucleoside-diphosphate-sugar epimerase
MRPGKFGKSNMRILISGATGFIGQKLTYLLCDNGHDVAILTRKDTFIKNVKSISADLDKSKNEIINFQPEILFHLAGSSIYSKSYNDQELLLRDNVFFGTHLLEILSDSALKKIIYFNTSLGYNDYLIQPNSYYALTKVCFYETLKFYCRINNIKAFNFILYNVYGENDNTKRALNYILDSIESPNPILMSPGDQKMDFIHVNDVLELCLQSLFLDPVDEVEDVHVGTGKGNSLKDVAQYVSNYLEIKLNLEFGGLPYRKYEKMNNVAPIEKNRFWKSTISLADGLKSMLK